MAMKMEMVMMMSLMVLGAMMNMKSVSGEATKKAKCSGKPAGSVAQYNADVVKLVSRMQQSTPADADFNVSDKEGSVKGKASCRADQNKSKQDAINDCTACLGSAIVELTTATKGGCKGFNRGTSFGGIASGLDGHCKMSFAPR